MYILIIWGELPEDEDGKSGRDRSILILLKLKTIIFYLFLKPDGVSIYLFIYAKYFTLQKLTTFVI